MKKVIYTCDICGNVMEKPEETFTLPVHIGYHTSDHLITTPNPPKIVAESYMLCERCELEIANCLLDRGIIKDLYGWAADDRDSD